MECEVRGWQDAYGIGPDGECNHFIHLESYLMIRWRRRLAEAHLTPVAQICEYLSRAMRYCLLSLLPVTRGDDDLH